ncbi:DUF1572 family protein [Niabella drilacis]|uniref:DinB superfamily protein n=1 Tax=Niabella drilacis (strain DSM 25811 / CCM 8410 / CCUG 62505 / LMG 26954 / E90) TaxID=1285928 RepID=A0A1G6TVF3_NIADE|nr:DUF1572 family protein [Niabella drilacis]SDD33078.1 Protein of unknown function [Niabella drilacis]
MNGTIFIQSAIRQFKDYKALAEKTFAQLGEADFYFQPDVANNNLAVNITHMHGNMLSRWTNFLTEDGEKEWRQRDAEFEQQQLDQARLMELWEEGWRCLLSTLESLKPEDLEKTVTIRTKPLTVIEAVHRQLTHYAYHVGQIVFIGKHIRKDQWESLSIKKGASHTFNEQLKSGAR